MVELSVTGVNNKGNTTSISQTLTLFQVNQMSEKFSNTHNRKKLRKLSSQRIYALFQLYSNTFSQQDLKYGIITKKLGNY